MELKRWPRWVWASVWGLVLVAWSMSLGCSGCGSDGRDDGAFVVLMDASPHGLDPRFATTDASAKLVALMHEGLISTDTQDGTMEYRLARSVEQTSPTTYEIELRDDARFHDGEPVTARDVEYTYMTLDEVGSPLAGLNERIKEFDIIDDHRFVLELKEPHAPFENDLGMGILPRHICEGHRTCPGEPVGAGPFQFAERDGELYFAFEAFEDHFETPPAIERLVFRVIRDDNARMLALLGQTADLAQNAVPPLMLPVVEEAEGLQMETAQSFGYTYLAFNLEHPKLSDQKVRQAIAYAINRDEIIEYKYRGTARPSTGMLVPEHWAYEEDVRTYGYDPAKARQLLDEAGFPEDERGVRMELEFKVSASSFRRSLAQLMAQQMREVGIEVRVRAFEWGTFFDDIRSRNFEMTTLQWPSVQEPDLYRWIFHSENIPTADARAAGANRGAYKNERVDELLDKGRVETERDNRREIYGEVQQILAEELPYISLWHPDNVAVLREGTQGYYTTPNARFDALRVVIPARASEVEMHRDVTP